MGRALPLVALTVIALTAPAAAKVSLCPGGRFDVVDGPASLRRVVVERATLYDLDAMVSIDGVCPPVPGQIRPGPRGTSRVRARWAGCLATGGVRTRLRARLDDGCRTMQGTVRRGRRPRAVRFAAIRAPTCGNGALEVGEACDDGNTADGDCCTAACEFAPECAPCATFEDCPGGMYCVPPPGACGGAGVCMTLPVACMLPDDPVCGCDANTYRSACEAMGVGVAAAGPCPSSCGTILGLACAPGGFCELPPGSCSSADLEGTCIALAGGCPRNIAPVCGCNGETYANDCVRRSYGVQKDHDGACGSACTRAADCGAGHACITPPFRCDARGTCVAQKPGLACITLYDPVCGCDGHTHSNACFAGLAGASIASSGPCP